LNLKFEYINLINRSYKVSNKVLFPEYEPYRETVNHYDLILRTTIKLYCIKLTNST